MTDAGARTAGPAHRFADVRRHAEVGSTNDVAAELARAGAAEGVVVVADHQTAGRGRRGRSWTARPGSSLLVSVVLRPVPEHDLVTLIPLACGLAAADACLDVAGFEPALKWPNDLVVGRAKLGGVLAELVPDPRGAAPAVVLGLGLNLRWPIDDTDHMDGQVAAAEQVAGRPVMRDPVLDAFLAALERRYGALGDADGRDALLGDYRRRSATIGGDVRVELPGGRLVAGWATDVAPDGRLAVREASGAVRLVAAGDVVRWRPPPPNFGRSTHEGRPHDVEGERG